MSETGFWIFNKAFSFGAELLYAACLTLFLRPFMAKRGHRRRECAIVFSAYFLTSLFCSWIAAWQGSFILLLLLLLTAASKALELERTMTFLLGLLYWNAKISSGLTVESLYFIGDRLLPYPTDRPEAVYLRSAVLLLLLLLSHIALFTIMLYALLHRMKKQRLPPGRLELCYISLIPAAGILFGQLISGLLYEIKDGEMLFLYERHPAFLAVVPVLALMFYMGAYLTVMFQQSMAELQEEQTASFVERQQTQTIRARIQEAEQFYSRIRQLKHEMRGHLTNIKGLVRSGEYASLEEYISRMDESMSDFELTLRTGNPVTDVIISDKRRQCQGLRIHFQVDFHYPDSGNYDAFDLGIILQNLLQNALDACEKVTDSQRFISLTGKRKGRFFLIEVKNSFSGNLEFGSDGLPVTAKKTDISMHGIGLSNVRRTVEKYMGEMEISQEEQVFRITVMVQEKS